MATFVMGALALCIVSYLLTISVQLIRIERAIEETARLVDVRVRKAYEAK